jgi:membrane protease YdiL (CAAX protease family)
MEHRPLRAAIPFFVAAVLLSWAVWIPLAVTQVDVRQAPWRHLMMVGGVGIVFIVRWRSYRRREFVRALFSPMQIGAKSLGLMLLAIVIPFGLSLAIDYVTTGTLPDTQRFRSGLGSPVSWVFVFLSLVYSGPLTEEFGWRGFATRHLLPQLGVPKVGLLVGAIWSVWHYPLLFLNGQYDIHNYLLYIPLHLLKHIGLATIITCFFERTNNSILAAIMIHFLSNTLANLFYPIALSANAAHTVLLLLAATALVFAQTSWRKRRAANGLPHVWRTP